MIIHNQPLNLSITYIFDEVLKYSHACSQTSIVSNGVTPGMVIGLSALLVLITYPNNVKMI